MSANNTYQNNNWKLLASNIGNDSTFTIGVFVVFMLSVGLSLSQVSLVISSWLIATSIGSIPAGMFADKYGYKKALLYGSILFLLGTIIFAFGQNFYWFLIGYSLLGFGCALKQGPQYAFLYEGLREDNKVEEYKRAAGKIDLFTNVFWVISSISGAFLYTWNHRLPFYAEIAIAVISFFSILILLEPPIKKHETPLVQQLKDAFHTTFTKPKFSKIFVFSAFIGSIALLTIQYVQPLYKAIHIPEAYFGIIAASFFIMRGLGSWYSHQLGKFFSVDKYLVLHAATFGLFLVLIQRINSAFFILPILAILYFLRGLYNPTISTYINDKVASHQRATILSINNQMLTLITAFSLIFTGYLADNYGLQTVFFMISILSMIFLIFYVVSLRKVETG